VIDDQTLLSYFHRGLIPGPAESEEDFLARVHRALPLNHLEWQEAAVKTAPFQFSIDWIPLSYSNRKIAWWEGAATWISEEKVPLIQMRTSFQKGSYLGYQRSDVLAHEAVHAARVCFEEPQFEEIIAYQTSPQAWKRFLGPLFSRTWEPLLMLLSLLIGVFWLWVPAVFIGAFFSWLVFRQWTFRRCCRKLPMSVVLCLTDAEIRKEAYSSKALFLNDKTARCRLLRLLWNRYLLRTGLD
jgi:hypothetical protein